MNVVHRVAFCLDLLCRGNILQATKASLTRGSHQGRRRTYDADESKTNGEESENAEEVPASARAPATVWKRMVDEIGVDRPC